MKSLSVIVSLVPAEFCWKAEVTPIVAPRKAWRRRNDDIASSIVKPSEVDPAGARKAVDRHPIGLQRGRRTGIFVGCLSFSGVGFVRCSARERSW